MKRITFILSLLLAGLCTAQAATNSTADDQSGKHWVGTWATSPMLVGDNNNPPSPGLANNSLRQIVQTSIGGETIRLKLTNHFGNSAVEIKAVELSLAKTAGSSSEVEESTTVSLTFDGKAAVTIPAGGMAVSDAASFVIGTRQNVAITIHYGRASSTVVSGHPGSRTTSYLKSGNTTDFTSATKFDRWYTIQALEVLAPEEVGAVVVLGNSITDGRGSTTNLQDRWTDVMSRHLLANEATKQIGVLNMGIGGNCVLSGGLGPTAVSRYQRDLFEQEGIKWIVLFEGINDLGGAADGVLTARRIIDVYRQIIRQAHAKGIRVFGATITPFKNNSYYSTNHEAGRQKLNNWIKTTQMLDGVIDFASMVCNPNDKEALNPSFLFENDWLHPNAAGYELMGNSVDVSLFTQTGSLAADDEVDEDEVTGIWIEAESLVGSTYGKNFLLVNDPMASGGQYLKTVNNITASASTDQKDQLMAEFNVETAGTYYIYGRLSCPSYDDDSYFVKIDDGEWTMVNGLFTGGSWNWLQLYKGTLTAGSHKFYMASREDGAGLDKLCITLSATPPVTMGGVTTGIPSCQASQSVIESLFYDLSGRRQSQLQHGVNIVGQRMADGSLLTRKVIN